MENTLCSVAYSTGLYKARIINVMKLILGLVFTIMLIFKAMRMFDLSIEIKISGDILWVMK